MSELKRTMQREKPSICLSRDEMLKALNPEPLEGLSTLRKMGLIDEDNKLTDLAKTLYKEDPPE